MEQVQHLVLFLGTSTVITRLIRHSLNFVQALGASRFQFLPKVNDIRSLVQGRRDKVLNTWPYLSPNYKVNLNIQGRNTPSIPVTCHQLYLKHELLKFLIQNQLNRKKVPDLQKSIRVHNDDNMSIYSLRWL
jgi:hypothetical protein